jgi:type IV secretory pathway VirD2 relaxase
VKARLVVLKVAGIRSTPMHLRYIERDGVTKDGQPGKAYDEVHDAADTQAFEVRGRGDRHQFRFIVAPEDAEQLDDLHTFTRNLMGRMETDLGTRMDWVAVDHWDTDNPHTHVVLRGKDDAGGDLIIARDYISHGMRQRACELATEWLGPRTKLEMHQGLLREVEQERWTSLDRTLKGLAKEGVVATARLPDGEQRSPPIGRLLRLSSMGLAEQESTGCWRLRPDVEATLRAMGERSDIVRTMQRALGRRRRDLAITDTDRMAASVIGRVLDKGLADELAERGYLIVDGVDGRAHYVPLSAGRDLADFPIGGIVEVRSNAEGRKADRTIAARARAGMYLASEHLAYLRTDSDARCDPETIVTTHVRRLESLRRAGLVERVSEGVWRIPDDLESRAKAHDRKLHGGVSVRLGSHLPIERQVRAVGATWLDSRLVTSNVTIEERGFGCDVRTALTQRKTFLVEQGFAEQIGSRVVLRRDLLAALRKREVAAAGKAIEAESGLMHQPVAEGQRIAGIYRRSIMLASGRFAMLDDGVGFSLVPWHPVIEQRYGRQVTWTVRAGAVSWDISRQRGVGFS